MQNAATEALLQAGAERRLRRVLKLSDLIFYGLIQIMPVAPIPIFGLIQKLSGGHAVTSLLIAMVPITLTAFSYGRMATLYPSAGSAYAYVGRGVNAHLGFLAGWAMLLGYLLIPLMCTTYAALTLQRLVPRVPHSIWCAVFVGVITSLNLRGIRSTAHTDVALFILMCSVIVIFAVLALRYVAHLEGWQGVLSTRAFYNPHTFDFHSLCAGTAFAALTYTGFDGVTTLAEDVEDPRRNVWLATVLSCLLVGIFGSLQVYLGQIVWPDFQTFTNLETAYMDVGGRVGGPPMFQAIGGILLLANFGAALSAQVSASRLLFGMGRDNALPRGIFAYLDPKRNNPSYSICITAVVIFAGTLALSYERSGGILDFAAFIVFAGVNFATVRQFLFLAQQDKRRRLLTEAVIGGLGFAFCLGILWWLPTPAKIGGVLWILTGFAYAAYRTRCFRIPPMAMDFGD
jgi:amino acid transporter